MVYTEIKKRNNKKYYYRTISIRNGKKISKKRKYLGLNLSKKQLIIKEKEADKELVKNKGKIALNIKKSIIKILKKNKIKKAGIFGSYARNEQTKNSDIDILIEPPKGIGFGLAGIEIELQNKLGKKVDLVTYKYISPYIKKDVLKEEIRIL